MDENCLDAIGIKYGTDKSSVGHGYLAQYDRLFSEFRNEDICILEIGIERGGSLRTWSDYFTKAKIVGIDIDADCKKHSGGRRIVEIGSQYDDAFLQSMGSKYKPTIIIDDGSHKTDHILFAFEHLWPHLMAGGLYIVEDVSAHGGISDHYKGTQSYDWASIYFLELAKGISTPNFRSPAVGHIHDEVLAVEFIYGAIAIRKKPAKEENPIWERRTLVHGANLPNLWGRFALFILRHQGSVFEAVDAARRGAALDPKSAEIRLYLSQALEAAGDIDNAIKEAEEAGRLDPISKIVRHRVDGLKQKQT